MSKKKEEVDEWVRASDYNDRASTQEQQARKLELVCDLILKNQELIFEILSSFIKK